MKIKVSIIVPVYNVDKYLKKSLESLINQTLQEIEIICINDGSTDNSLKILQEYSLKDTRIRLIDQANQGVSAARNIGISFATGEYIGFCDPDDWVCTDFYEKLYYYAVKYNCDFSACGIINIKNNKNKNILSYQNIEIAEKYYDKLKLFKCPDHCYIWNKIYKASELKKYNLEFVKGFTFEDVIFTPQALFHLKRGVTVPDINYFYCYRRNSIIHSKKYNKDCETAFSFCKIFLAGKKIDLKDFFKETKRYKIFNITIIKIITFQKIKIIKFLNLIQLKFKIKSR